MGSNGRTLLEAYNHQTLHDFLLDPTSKELTLPITSKIPGRTASKSRSASRFNAYTKVSISPGDHLNFIKKNGKPHGFAWHCTGKELQEALRFGIVKSESLSSQLVGVLGQYRLICHERIAKGVMTATQPAKLKLLSHYQDRLSLFFNLESLVNQPNTLADFEQKIAQYLEKLEALKITLDIEDLESIVPGIHESCISDIDASKTRATEYLATLRGLKPISPANRARGQNCILEFVKRESLQLIYEFQGLNQDISFSRARRFALTRGDLNDVLEDARLVIENHRADLKNPITAEHHRLYPDEDVLTLIVNAESYSPEEERRALLGISFIKGWDKVIPEAFCVQNKHEATENLDRIAATHWKPSRNFLTFLKSTGYFILNTLKSFFVSTQPWEEESWENPEFHLYAATLEKESRPNKPMWFKLVYFLNELRIAVIDLIYGIKDFAATIVIQLPINLAHDWKTTKAESDDFYHEANAAIEKIQSDETTLLNKILTDWRERLPQDKKETSCESSSLHTTLVASPYPLSTGEQNDILTAMVRGLNGFTTFFTHSIYSKDPVGGLIFTLFYLSGSSVMLFPHLGETLFGKAYVEWFQRFAGGMANTPLAGAIAGGSSQAQLAASAWDLLLCGPQSDVVYGVKKAMEDPLSIAAGFGIAFGVGYAMTNGHIPWLSESLKEELGTVPETSYPLIGAKFMIALYECLHAPHELKLHMPDFLHAGEEKLTLDKEDLERLELNCWLSAHAAVLPSLDRDIKFKIEQRIERLFNRVQARSLKLLLHPQQTHSIAYQFIFIPLSYVASLLRLTVNVGTSLVAWYQEAPKPWEPIKRAMGDLGEKMGYDLNRILTFASELIRLVFKSVACVFKALLFTINLAVGRIGGLFKAKPGHSIHRGFAGIHRGLSWFREWLFPVRIGESVATAHPICTMKQSYEKLTTQLRMKHGEGEVPQAVPYTPPVVNTPTEDPRSEACNTSELCKAEG